MAVIKIEPISVTSNGGYQVVLSGISPTYHDCIIGEIDTPGMGKVSGEWNLSGIMRGGTSDCSLDMRVDELRELGDLARALGATA